MLGYRLAWLLALPLVALRLAWRAAADASYRPFALERFAVGLPAGPFDLCVHAVSVGETRAAEPIIKAWLRGHPEARILLTHMTPTGRATGAEIFGSRVSQCYLPYDAVPLVQTFLRQSAPKVFLVMETEVWPEWIAQARARGVPVWLVNARLSAKSARGYGKFPRLSKNTFGALSGVHAQTAADAARLTALGATGVKVSGNVKFDCTPPEDFERRAAALSQLFDAAHRPLWVAGSTREGEEALLFDALKTHRLRSTARAVIVPRHPQRFGDVVALALASGFTVARRSTFDPVTDANAEIIIGDSMGEMFAYYKAASVALMGGSFGTGSQNLIEPCAVGTPVILGPSVYNFVAAAAAAQTCGAAVQVAAMPEALDVVHALMQDAARRANMSAAGLQFVEENRGSTARILRDIRP